MKILTTKNYKILKGKDHGVLTAMLHLAPANLSGFEVCPGRTKGCTAVCLNTSGYGRYKRAQLARIRRTKLFFENPEEFWEMVIWDIKALIRKADRENLKPAVRMNGTSDINWLDYPYHGLTIFERFPGVQFYDYTKRLDILTASVGVHNWTVVFSYAETTKNHNDAQLAVQMGFSLAAVFESLPSEYLSLPVVDGDLHDLIFTRNGQMILGLEPKGRAIHDKSGFVIRQ